MFTLDQFKAELLKIRQEPDRTGPPRYFRSPEGHLCLSGQVFTNLGYQIPSGCKDMMQFGIKWLSLPGETRSFIRLVCWSNNAGHSFHTIIDHVLPQPIAAAPEPEPELVTA